MHKIEKPIQFFFSINCFFNFDPKSKLFFQYWYLNILHSFSITNKTSTIIYKIGSSDSTFSDIVNGPKGHIVFFMPICPKSAKITFMPVAEQLVKRGHNVTLVTPYKSDVKWNSENFRDIVVMSGYIDKMMDQFSANMWGTSNLSMYQKAEGAFTYWNEKTKQIDEVTK